MKTSPNVALSDALPEDNWDGYTGLFIMFSMSIT